MSKQMQIGIYENLPGTMVPHHHNATDDGDFIYCDVRAFGAVCDGIADDTAPIQDAINALKATDHGGILCFPAGDILITTLNLNYTGASGEDAHSQSIRLVGAGPKSTRLIGTLNGSIMLDCIGRDFLTVENMELRTDGIAVYQAAVLLARRDEELRECQFNTFRNFEIKGDFSIACVVSIAAETIRYYNCGFQNNSIINNYCAFFTSLNNAIAGIVSANGTVFASTNTDCMMIGCWFIADHDNVTLIIMDEHAEYDFLGCTAIVGNHTGVKFVTYIAGEYGDTFHGPVNWVGTLWEGASGIVHYLTTGAGLGYYWDIADEYGKYTLYGAASTSYAFDTDGVPAMCYNLSIRNPSITLGAASVLNIEVDYARNCYFDIWTPGWVTTITLSERLYSRISDFKASILAIPGFNYAATPVTVDPSQCRAEILTNLGAGAGIEFDLPAAKVGMEITFFVLAIQTITIDPNGADQIMVLTSAPGDYLRSDAVIGSYIKLACLATGKWYKTDIAGVWTEE